MSSFVLDMCILMRNRKGGTIHVYNLAKLLRLCVDAYNTMHITSKCDIAS